MLTVNGQCTFCGGKLTTAGYAHTANCPAPSTVPAKTAQGWQCPSCGGGLAPHVDRCPCKPLPAPSFRYGGMAPLKLGDGVAPLTFQTTVTAVPDQQALVDMAEDSQAMLEGLQVLATAWACLPARMSPVELARFTSAQR